MTDTTETPDRFQIEPHFKRSQRYSPANPSGQVKDGFLVRDALTGDSRRVDLKREAKARIETVLAEEQAIDWTGVAHYDFPTPRHWQAITEVYAYSADGERLTVGRGAPLVIVGVDRDESVIEGHVVRWLQAMGHPEITRLPR